MVGESEAVSAPPKAPALPMCGLWVLLCIPRPSFNSQAKALALPALSPRLGFLKSSLFSDSFLGLQVR